MFVWTQELHCKGITALAKVFPAKPDIYSSPDSGVVGLLSMWLLV